MSLSDPPIAVTVAAITTAIPRRNHRVFDGGRAALVAAAGREW